MCNYTVNVPRHLKEEPRFCRLVVMGVSPRREVVRVTMTVRRLDVLVMGVSHRLMVLLLVIRVARCQRIAKFDTPPPFNHTQAEEWKGSKFAA